MCTWGTATPLPLHHLPPPYAELVPVPSLETAERLLSLGSVLALEIRDPVVDWPLVVESLPLLRRRFPAVPHALWVPGGGGSTMLELARRAGQWGVRAVLVAGGPYADALRRSLAHPVDLGGQVVEWLELVDVRLTPRTRELGRVIFDRAGAYRRIGELLAAMRWSERSARYQMRKRRLAPPERWFGVARALGAALRLQADTTSSATRLAMEMGYGGHSGLSRLFARTFGLAVPTVRSIAGWEPLMMRALPLLVPQLGDRVSVSAARDRRGNFAALRF